MMNNPVEILKANINAQVNRTKMPIVKMVFLGILAGMFIACGASASSVAMHAIPNVGLARTVAGCVFPIGLMLIVFIGGELFTGDCLLILGNLKKEYSVFQTIRVLLVVWCANLIGSVVFAAMVYFSGQYNYSDGLLGAFTIKVALGKVTMSFGKAFVSGILCNIFVCGAVLMAAAAKDVAGKVWAIFFPILAFVVSGYEHCVANMYYIPAGIFALNDDKYVQVAMDTYGYTESQLAQLSWKTFFINSSIPVTLGNVVGGMVFLGVILFIVYKKDLTGDKN
ncbi:MAG: formate/nitrite transporter family protein [Agathobacter sp.]|nr:formate/nitrite transporter family protein [Agathobacter sp.]